jgi:uncharacterized repeat protein (TIGR03806 family)
MKSAFKGSYSSIAFLALLLFSAVLFLFSGCKKDEIIEPVPTPPPAADGSGVSVDLATVPYQNLSEYQFFTGDLKDQIPADGVVPYQPASSLFTDYALKKRFIWMPPGVKASYDGDHNLLVLPVGTALIKTFYYNNVQPSGATRIIETRVMIRKSSGWIFAEYVWNAAQTEATLDMLGSYTDVSWLQNGTPKATTYRIPSETECLICHKDNGTAIPIGIKPQNINWSYPYSDGSQNQLLKLIEQGYLENNLPANIVSTIDYADENYPLRLRLRSYLDANCAHCHRQNSHCDYRPLRLAFSETVLGQNMGICVTPDETLDPSLIEIIVPGNVNKSMMHFRLSSTSESNRMPLLGRTIVHEEGVQLLTDFINSITNCD